MPELKGRREPFCREYLKDLNATKAAERAGYSPDRAAQTGSELMTEPSVQGRVAELGAEHTQRLQLDADTVLTEAWRLMTTNLGDAFDENGALKPIHEMPFDLCRAIKSIESRDTWQNGQVVGRVHTIKLWSKEKAIEMLARHLSLFNDKLKVDGLDGLAQRIIAARARAGWDAL